MSASRCHISEYVSGLRDLGVTIDTVGFRNHPKTGQQIYGMYELQDKITVVEGAA